MVTENSNRPHGHGLINPNHFSPYPKNPVIARFFKQIGWADELGSGVRKLFRYSKHYGGKPILDEGDIFKAYIPLNKADIKTDAKETTLQVTPQVNLQVTPQVRKLLGVLKGDLPRAKLMKAMALKDRGTFQQSYLEPALKSAFIEMTQPDSPNSPTQKYRLTDKGKNYLKEIKK